MFSPAPPTFRNRTDAGRQLAARLGDLAGRKDVIVLALPRGGVPVAAEVARALGAPLRVYLVRKIGAPGNPELALGALAADGTRVVDAGLVCDLDVAPEFLAEAVDRAATWLAERAAALRAWLPPADLTRSVVVVVDDGVATGATAAAALQALRAGQPGALVLAVPVGPTHTLNALAHLAGRVEAVIVADAMPSVGAWYADFGQVSDDAMRRLLTAAADSP